MNVRRAKMSYHSEMFINAITLKSTNLVNKAFSNPICIFFIIMQDLHAHSHQ